MDGRIELSDLFTPLFSSRQARSGYPVATGFSRPELNHLSSAASPNPPRCLEGSSSQFPMPVEATRCSPLGGFPFCKSCLTQCLCSAANISILIGCGDRYPDEQLRIDRL